MWENVGMCTQVPADVPPRELAVSLEPFLIRVAHALSGEVYHRTTALAYFGWVVSVLLQR